MVVNTQRGQKRSVEEAPSYGVGHRIRIEILGVLNEGTHSASELARLIHQPLTTIGHHIKELVNSGCIELARIEKVRNVDQHFYRAVQLPFITDEEWNDEPPEVKQEYAALVLQAIMAEGLGSLWAGKMRNDPRLRLMCGGSTSTLRAVRNSRMSFANRGNESWRSRATPPTGGRSLTRKP